MTLALSMFLEHSRSCNSLVKEISVGLAVTLWSLLILSKKGKESKNHEK